MNNNLEISENKTNLLGEKLSPSEIRIWKTYLELRDLVTQKDLPPFAEHNMRSALALIWQVVNGLNIDFETLEDLGV